MLKQVEGIIVSSVNYGETSKIINILTKEGMIGAIAKGAKNIKSPLRSFTVNLTYGSFYLYYNDNKLSTLKSADIINEFKNIKKDIILISYMSFLIDLATQVMKQNNDEEIYNLLITTLYKIDDGLNPMVMTNILELKYLDSLGVGFDFNTCKNCYTNEIIYDSKTLKMLRMYYLVDIKSISKLKISENVVKNINYFVNTYYDRYTGLYLKSKKFLNELIN